MKQAVLFLFMMVCVFSSTAQQSTKKITTKKPAKTKETKKANSLKDDFEMKTYHLVLLKKGPNRSQDSATAAKIQEGHMAHLTKMYNEGKMDLAGPMMDDWEVRGICVYNIASMDEVKKLVELDPAIQSGRLIAEIHPWFAGKGSVLR